MCVCVPVQWVPKVLLLVYSWVVAKVVALVVYLVDLRVDA